MVTKVSIKMLLDSAAQAIASQADLTFQAPELEARLLFSFATTHNHAWMISHACDVVTDVIKPEQLVSFNNALALRLSGKPIAFILGTQAFWTLTLKVSDCTLIPRQDTEVLVEAALVLPIPDEARVLDIGTGTGAIALALAKEKPEWQVTGLDKIAEAVALAKENAILNQLNARFLKSNWFSAISLCEEKFDLIISNPPYVETDSEYVKQGDLRFEPLSALVSGKDGLDDIRLIVAQANQFLSKGGYLMLEHGKDQGQTIARLLLKAGFIDIQCQRDYNHLPRVTVARYF